MNDMFDIHNFKKIKYQKCRYILICKHLVNILQQNQPKSAESVDTFYSKIN